MNAVRKVEWYEKVPGRMTRGQLYSHKALISFLHQERPDLSKSGYHWAIDKMIQSGIIERRGYGEYSIADDKKLRIYTPAYSEESVRIMGELSAKYPYVAFTVFETALLNSFLNHLIGQNTIFLQVEKDNSIYVFRYLQEEGYTNLLYKPGIDEFHLYFQCGMIVVTDLISEAPVRNDEPHTIMLEKMLVDICADKLIASTYSKAELPAVFEQVKERYVLDRPRMIRYARRRNKASEISGYLKGDSDDA